MVSDVPTPFHAVPNRNILGKPMPKLHTRQRTVLGSKLVRRVNPTRLVKRKILPMCRPPPKPPDRQNSLNDKASKKIFPDIHHANEEKVNYRPPPKPPFILNVSGEVIGIIEKENLPYVIPKPRPLPKPRIHGNDNREGIRDQEKENLLGIEPNYRPPPTPPKVCNIARVPWTR